MDDESLREHNGITVEWWEGVVESRGKMGNLKLNLKRWLGFWELVMMVKLGVEEVEEEEGEEERRKLFISC